MAKSTTGRQIAAVSQYGNRKTNGSHRWLSEIEEFRASREIPSTYWPRARADSPIGLRSLFGGGH